MSRIGTKFVGECPTLRDD